MVAIYPSALTVVILGPAAAVGVGVIAAQIRQGRTALLAVMLGSVLASGVVCVLIFWDTVTGPLSSNHYPWVVAGGLVGVAVVSITVALGFAVGRSLVRLG